MFHKDFFDTSDKNGISVHEMDTGIHFLVDLINPDTVRVNFSDI